MPSSMASDASEIGIVPMGGATRWFARALSRPLAEVFSRPAAVAPGMRAASAAWRADRRQFAAEAVLDALATARSAGWHRVLGVVEVDLYRDGLQYAFGAADSARGVAVISSRRLREAGSANDIVDLLVSEAVHELARTYGLARCSSPRCVMWFSNSVEDTRRKGRSFCPAHDAEIRAATLAAAA
jgi:archaemetzincin